MKGVQGVPQSQITASFCWLFKDIHSDYWKVLAISLITAGGVIKLGSVTGTLQQIISGKVPKGNLAIMSHTRYMYHKSSKFPHRYNTFEGPLYHPLQ